MIIADDFGISNKVNREIFKLVKQKNVDVVSVLANFADSKSIKNLAKHVHIAAHLNLVEGKPVTKQDKIPSLVDNQGNFFNFGKFVFKYFSGKINIEDVELELTNQLQFFSDLKIKISTVNSHQYLLSLPSLSVVQKKLLKKYKITRTRTRQTISRNLRKKPVKLLILRALWLIDLAIFHQSAPPDCGYEIEKIVHPGTRFDRWFS